jgi:threonine synthase
MDDAIRIQLAETFEQVIEEIRENKWQAFCEAAEEMEISPYTALARLLVRIVESPDGVPDDSA